MVGFAHLYLQRCQFESKPVDEVDIQAYSKLVELDARLGTSASKQLYWCLVLALRSDFIKVWIEVLNILTKMMFKTIDFARIEGPMERTRNFADLYLLRTTRESELNGETEIELYQKLLKLETRLGKSVSNQLFMCLSLTIRSDIIKVLSCYSKSIFKFQNYLRLSTSNK